jgi:hypothetical protein
MKTRPRQLSLRQPLVMTMKKPTGAAASHVLAGEDAPLPITRRFVGTDAAAEYLCLSPRYLQQLRMDGNGPPYRCFGRFVVYMIEDLDRWADEQPVFRSTSDRVSLEGGQKGKAGAAPPGEKGTPKASKEARE